MRALVMRESATVRQDASAYYMYCSVQSTCKCPSALGIHRPKNRGGCLHGETICMVLAITPSCTEGKLTECELHANTMARENVLQST